MTDYTVYSAPELVKVLGIRFKDYRLRARMTQKDVAEQTGLTIPTIQRFENGLSGNITLGTFILLMKAVGCINGLDEMMPDQPESLYLYNDNYKKVQRVRHKRDKL
jgi:transcriptional regulator with XRE-family HTH domain